MEPVLFRAVNRERDFRLMSTINGSFSNGDTTGVICQNAAVSWPRLPLLVRRGFRDSYPRRLTSPPGFRTRKNALESAPAIGLCNIRGLVGRATSDKNLTFHFPHSPHGTVLETPCLWLPALVSARTKSLRPLVQEEWAKAASEADTGTILQFALERVSFASERAIHLKRLCYPTCRCVCEASNPFSYPRSHKEATWQ